MESVTNIASQMAVCLSPTLIMNAVGLILLYSLLQTLTAVIRRYILYFSIRSSSLGYQSRIIVDDIEYRLVRIDKKSVHLSDTTVDLFVPLEAWQVMIKKIPKT